MFPRLNADVNRVRAVLRFILGVMVLGGVLTAAAQVPVSLVASDNWQIRGLVYGDGKQGVVLVHGGRFRKESWEPQAQLLTNAGFRALAIDLRGFGQSTNGPAKLRSDSGFPLDVLAGVGYLRKTGATNVHVIGGSMGGWAAGEASALAKPGEIDSLIFIGSEGGDTPERLQGRKLFITARDDVNGAGELRLTNIVTHFKRAPEPKKIIILEGSAHAQFIFATDQGDRLTTEILRFLRKETPEEKPPIRH